MTHPMHLDLPAAERWSVTSGFERTDIFADPTGPWVAADEHLKMIAAMQHKINTLEAQIPELNVRITALQRALSDASDTEQFGLQPMVFQGKSA